MTPSELCASPDTTRVMITPTHQTGGLMERIQLRRTKGWRIPPGAVIVDRRTPWGNPYRVGDHPLLMDHDTGDTYRACIHDAKDAVDLFRIYARWCLIKEPAWLDPLRCADALACWCKPGAPCHADVLIELMEESR